MITLLGVIFDKLCDETNNDLEKVRQALNMGEEYMDKCVKAGIVDAEDADIDRLTIDEARRLLD